MNKKPDIIIPAGKTFGVLDDLGNMRVFEMVAYTPELASVQVTQNNDGNRSIRNGNVEKLALAMRDGRFIAANSQTIAIDAETGNLLDGQHRLLAIAKSGCTQRLLTEYLSNSKEAYLTMDSGAKRSAADFLADEKGASTIAPIAAAAVACEDGIYGISTSLGGGWRAGSGKTKSSGAIQVPRDIVVRYIETHYDEMRKCASVGEALRKASKNTLPASACGIFYWLVRYCERDTLLDEFVEEFCGDATSKTVSFVKLSLASAGKTGRSRITRVYIVGKLLDAYEHYCKFDDCVNLSAHHQRLAAYESLVNAKREKAKLEEDTNA